MGALFTVGLLAYYFVFLRSKAEPASILARLLWLTYFALGCTATVIDLTKVFEPIFDPNYLGIVYLLVCILISISGFLAFRSQDVRDVIATVRGQALIEGVLIALQGFAIAFFLPFAMESLSGDASANRLELSTKAAVLATYGLANTVAGAGSHLFAVSLVMAGIRLCQPKGQGYSLVRALLLMFVSLSYVIYILAYVGRDGSIYWLMTALLVFLIFRAHMPTRLRRRIIAFGASLCGLILLPIVTITASRFADNERGAGFSLLEYFGTQIINFSDYASIERPMTYGAMNFPLLWKPYCSIFGLLGCEDWEDIKGSVFDQYLFQGKAPWLFATYVSDFIADFGYVGVLLILAAFAVVCRYVCAGRDRNGMMSAPRLIMVVFLFLTPYWGVFYFRFGIINVFLVMNLIFITFIWAIQRYYPLREYSRGIGANSSQPGVRVYPRSHP